MDEILDEVPPAARWLGSRVELQSPDQVHSRMKPKIDPKSNHHPRKSNPSHQIPIMEVDMSYIPIIMPWCFIILKSVHIFYSRSIMFWPVLSPWLNEVSVSRFARIKLHSREAWPLSTSIANYTFAFSFEVFQCSYVHGLKSWIPRSQDVPRSKVLHQGVCHLLKSVDCSCIQTQVLLKCSWSFAH